MTNPPSRHLPSCGLRKSLPGEAVLIIGSGHFGNRAVRLLAQKRHRPLLVVDEDADRLEGLNRELSVETFCCNAIEFLWRNFSLLHPFNYLIPAVPVHLAFEWLIRHLQQECTALKVEVPETIRPHLPHTWKGGEGSLLVSYADFLCPDDCPEPADFCTVTGLKRDVPLYRRLENLEVPEYHIHVVRSRQLAPGLGGYRVEDLARLLARVKDGGKRKWLVGTACRCHGTLSAMEIRTGDP